MQRYKIETKQIEICALFYYWESLVRRRATAGLVQQAVYANLQVLRPSERQWKPRLRQALARSCVT